MATPGSSFTPTYLGHEDNLEIRHHPRANALQDYELRELIPKLSTKHSVRESNISRTNDKKNTRISDIHPVGRPCIRETNDYRNDQQFCDRMLQLSTPVKEPKKIIQYSNLIEHENL
ncbi:hypothetical protein TNCV_724611 [Trichonephila clavipes]|nr:hypothetical protein TNCV_724611 [Trichonephila clavipes]